MNIDNEVLDEIFICEMNWKESSSHIFIKKLAYISIKLKKNKKGLVIMDSNTLDGNHD